MDRADIGLDFPSAFLSCFCLYSRGSSIAGCHSTSRSSRRAAIDMVATQVCLTDRNQSLPPLTQEMGGAAFFVAAIVLAGALLRGDDPRELYSLRQQPRQFRCTRSKPCLSHFFFLPPPVPQISL